MQRLALVVVSLVVSLVVGGCHEDNPESCQLPSNAGIGPCPPADATDAPPAGPECKDSTECTADPELRVCDTEDNGGTCVKCTDGDHSDCPLATRRCQNHMCVACVGDTDCDEGGVCLPGGACAPPASIIYAKVAGTNLNGCGAITNACSLSKALADADAQRNVIRLDSTPPAVYSDNGFNATIDKMFDLTIDARGATLKRSDGGPVLTVMTAPMGAGHTLTILGGTIQGATGGNGDGILCTMNTKLVVVQTAIETNSGSGIDSTDCTVTLTGAQIRGNALQGIDIKNGLVTASQSLFVANKLGGVRIGNNAKFVLVGNAISGNGDSNNSNASVAISTVFDANNHFDFNTVSSNTGQAGVPAFSCAAGMSPSGMFLVGRYNIIWGNTGQQVSGNCQFATSDVDQDLVVSNNDAGNNLQMNPSFASDGYHIMSTSPVVRKADTGADLLGPAAKDIDGEARIAPADLGADQLPRP